MSTPTELTQTEIAALAKAAFVEVATDVATQFICHPLSQGISDIEAAGEMMLDLIERQASMRAALAAILYEVEGIERPFDGDSYLPPHLVAQARSALEGAT